MRKSSTTEQFFLFGLLAFILLLIESLGFTRPLKSTMEIPIVSIKSQTFGLNTFLQYLAGWKIDKDEIIRLRAQVNRLSSTSAELISLSAENAALRQQLNVSLSFSSELIAASPIGFSGGQLTIDIGRHAGVSDGAAVILGRSLIGRVDRLSENQSVVLLPISEGEKISVAVRATPTGVKKASGLLIGQGDKMILDKVSPSEEISVGDLVMTVGEGFPRDLVVGTIGQIIPATGQLFKKAQVDQVVDFSNVERVFVVKF